MTPEAAAELMAKRRMIKPSAMTDQAVPVEVLESILEAGNWAPSHRLTEPWRFVVLTGEARRALGAVFLEALMADRPDADAYTREKIAGKPMRSPVLIAVICQPSDRPKVSLEEEKLAVACAIQNMSLQATAHGLSLFWSTGTPTAHPRVAEFLGCRGSASVMGCLHVGFPEEGCWPEGRRGAWNEKVVWFDGAEINVPVWRPTPAPGRSS